METKNTAAKIDAMAAAVMNRADQLATNGNFKIDGWEGVKFRNVVQAILEAIAAPQAAAESAVPERSGESAGCGVVCQAMKQDGIGCPQDSCDREDGTRPAPTVDSSAPSEAIVTDWPACNPGCDYEDPHEGHHDCRSDTCSCEAAKASIARQRKALAAPTGESLSAALGQMRSAFHVNMLRAFPDKSHAEIAAEIDRACGAAPPSVQGVPELTVQQEPKYGGTLFNRASGEAIPADEPVFIFRARDYHALDVLVNYSEICTDNKHKLAVIGRAYDFRLFRESHPDRMKEPDTAAPAPGASK